MFFHKLQPLFDVDDEAVNVHVEVDDGIIGNHEMFGLLVGSK